MKIKEFINQYNNYPILFIGTGMDLRYFQQAYNWEGLLKQIACDFRDIEYFKELKYTHIKDGNDCDYAALASEMSNDFDMYCKENRNGKFKDINDVFYSLLDRNIKVSRLKLYVAKLLSSFSVREEKQYEIECLKNAKKNIAAIITTNYDKFIETQLQFNPLIGNDILLSNPYGSVYKIHGCVSKPEKIILTAEDYTNFSDKYELIRAQLLSLFIHHPIIFLGYSINDSNIKEILKTIFTYVELNSPQAQKIRDNFLLVEYVENSVNEEVFEHDIELEGFETIRINRLPTDNYSSIYNALKELTLPVSVMDIRKVQNIVKEIYAGGKIKVSVATDIDRIANSEKILIIGNKDKIQYVSMQTKDFIEDYFNIIGNPNVEVIKLIDRLRIQSSQYFPIFAFSSICGELKDAQKLQNQQIAKLQKFLEDEKNSRSAFSSVDEILNSDMAQWRKDKELTLAILNDKISHSEAQEYLTTYSNEKSSDYRRLLCAYDYKAYSETQDLKLHP